jgi:hypothetical protein
VQTRGAQARIVLERLLDERLVRVEQTADLTVVRAAKTMLLDRGLDRVVVQAEANRNYKRCPTLPG